MYPLPIMRTIALKESGATRMCILLLNSTNDCSVSNHGYPTVYLMRRCFHGCCCALTEACEQPFTSFIRDSVIQRFEFCRELVWKILKLCLKTVGVQVLTPRDVFQESLNKGLIRDGNALSEAQKMRNLNRHTCDEKLADTVYSFLINQGRLLFKELAHDVALWRKEIP